MDLLKKEVERKRRLIKNARESNNVIASHIYGSKYLRAKDLFRFQRDCKEQESKTNFSFDHQQGLLLKRNLNGENIKKEDIYIKHNTKFPKKSVDSLGERLDNDRNQHKSNCMDSLSQETDFHLKYKIKFKGDEYLKMSSSQLTHALRELGIPVRLFGEESDIQRMERLISARESRKATLAGMSEMNEFRLERGHGIRNTFLGRKSIVDDELKLFGRSGSAVMDPVYDRKRKYNDDDDLNDPHKYIHRFFKSLLRSWEDELTQRSDVVKRTTIGRNEIKTLKQCRDYIRPLFKLLKNRRLEGNIMEQIFKIVKYCKDGEFLWAHDAYMNVAIGRAAWPIGVTMVGIHARSGRAKIESANVAHVMNSELQRKYLTSIKRLMSYCQKTRPDVAPSKKVMNL